ncbi:MAG: glycosyltransferase family 1 protein [Bacteroidetes bacterium CHB5]|nr:glycosyltransferase family 1 protein [Bacteroidetes bacterium CHB5]
MPEIRILHCIRQGQIGGGESHVLDLVKNLDRKRFICMVLSFTDGPMINRLHEQGIPAFVVPTRFPFDFRIWRSVSKVIVDNNIDVIHVHGTRAFSNCFISAKRINIPIIYTVHGWSFNDYQNIIRHKLTIAIEKYFTKVARVVINVSESNRETGCKVIPNLKSEVIQNGINTEIFNTGQQFKNLRKELNIEDNTTVIGFIARMTYQKDPLTLILAFHQLVQKKIPEKKFLLLMIGDGEKKAGAIKLVNELNLTAMVRFESFRNDIPDLLNILDVFCLPSLWEGLPLSVLEAMAMKKIVVATAVDGTREIINHNINGYLFTPQNATELCKFLEEGSKTNSHNDNIRSNALKTIQEKFTLKCMIQKTEQIYGRFINSES